MKYTSCFTLGLVLLHAWTSTHLLTEGKSQSHAYGLGMVAENSGCACDGDTLTFSCTVFGGSSTVWQGRAFDNNCRIPLLHSQFALESGTRGSCNNGGVVAQSEFYSVNHSTNTSLYTSYLRVVATPDLNNTDVQCLLYINSQLLEIGSYNISIISEYALSPPTDIYLSRVNYTHITFAWTPPTSQCQPSTFFAYTSNCGKCPSFVDGNDMTCMDLVVNGRMCSVHVQRVACSNITGKNSSVYSILPKLPSRPNVTATSHYDTENLTWVEVQISSDSLSQEPFRIIAHTIDYVDAVSGYKCASNTKFIEVSSCRGSKCISIFELSSSSSCTASSKLNVSVFTNNSFGAGPPSQPITIDHLNRFLNVTFESTSGVIICSFQEECNCTCHIEYGICNNHSMSRLTLGNSLGATYTSPIKPTISSQYCYSASATMASVGLTVIVRGTFHFDEISVNNDQTMTECIDISVIYAMSCTVVVSLIAALIVAIVSCIYVRSRLRTINTECIQPIYDDLQDIKESSIYADTNVAYSTS